MDFGSILDNNSRLTAKGMVHAIGNNTKLFRSVPALSLAQKPRVSMRSVRVNLSSE